MIVLDEEIVIVDDICISVKAPTPKTNQVLRFRYWLNARYLLEGVGKIQSLPFEKIDDLSIDHFMSEDAYSIKHKQND